MIITIGERITNITNARSHSGILSSHSNAQFLKYFFINAIALKTIKRYIKLSSGQIQLSFHKPYYKVKPAPMFIFSMDKYIITATATIVTTIAAIVAPVEAFLFLVITSEMRFSSKGVLISSPDSLSIP